MKILYALQATGNGHIARAEELLPYLQKKAEIDVLLSGNNYSLSPSFEYKYSKKGISLLYKPCGKLDFLKTYKELNPIKILRELNSLNLEKYDLIINDFEPLTSHLAKKYHKPILQIGHQASFQSKKTPRPDKKSVLGELILKKYATGDKYLGFHFEKYDEGILYPIIKKEILDASPINNGHITIYLPSVDIHCMYNALKKFANQEFHVFTNQVDKVISCNNIKYYPVSNMEFTKSMIEAHGIITGGGFETPSEAMYLKKRLLCIPIDKQYEQQCNAQASKLKGAYVIPKFEVQKFSHHINTWLEEDYNDFNQSYTHPSQVVDYIFSIY
ncbi:MAG: glycosyl transferase [Lewinellaceae bacterium]|nr:glycosyl transferase [Lewinellaceae bacterium]